MGWLTWMLGPYIRILYQRCEGQEKQCRITLGGAVECQSKEDTQRMVMEMRSVTMRWESKLTGRPKFCIEP